MEEADEKGEVESVGEVKSVGEVGEVSDVGEVEGREVVCIVDLVKRVAAVRKMREPYCDGDAIFTKLMFDC